MKGHVGAFKSRWFATQPVTEFSVYMIVPFAVPDDQFVDRVRTLGNVLHRLRTPRRVAEAARLVEAGAAAAGRTGSGSGRVSIEGYERLAEAARWVADYRAVAAA